MAAATERLRDRPGAWVDLGLTLPIFLLYHLAVVFFDVKNALDRVTGLLLELSHGSRSTYLGATVAIGLVFTGVFALLGRGQTFRPQKFFQIAVEGVVYAVLMRVGASYVVGRVLAGPSPAVVHDDKLLGFVMSLGAGFYEELAFRVILFGIGAKLLVALFARQDVALTGAEKRPRFTFRAVLAMLVWGLICGAIFSGVHYVGDMSDPFRLDTFLFRWVLGVALTLIFVTRGFAAAVWTHTVYDVWVLVF